MGLRSSLFDSSDEFDLDTSTSAEPRRSFSGSDAPAGLTQGLYGARANFYSMFSDPESRAKARVDRARAADVPVQFRSSEDVDWSSPSDIMDYAQQQAGALAGSSAPTLALAGGTYGLGAALGLPATALGRAASAAAFGGETLQGYGEMAGELRDAGQEPGAGTVLGSIGYGLLGMTELKGLYKGILESSSAELLHATGRAEGTKQSLLRSTLDATGTIAKGVAKGVARQVPEQTGQELAQEGILIGNRMAYDPNYDTGEIPGRLKETATATALGTGLAGGLAGGVGGVRTQMAKGKSEATPPEPVGLPRASQAELRQMRDQEAADAKAEFEADYRQGVAEYLGYELPPLLQPIFDQALPLPTGPAQTDAAHTASAPERPALPTELPAAPKPPEAPTSVQTTNLAQQPSIPGTSTMTTPPSDFTPPGATHEEANQASTNETTEQRQEPPPLLTEPTPPPRSSWQPHSQRESNAAITYRVLQENGIPPHVAAGIVGALSGESLEGSDLSPTAFNPSDPNGGSVGIAQWNSGRRTALIDFARRTGGDPTSFGTQLQYLLHELNGPERRALNITMRARNEREAAELFTRHFERPAEAAIQGSLNKRQNFASRVLRGGLAVPSGTYTQGEREPRIRSSLGSAVTSGQTRSLDRNAFDEETTDVTAETSVFEDMPNASVVGQSYDSDGHELTKDAAVSENPNVFRTIISGDEGDTKYSGSRVSKAFSAIFPNSVTQQKTDGPTLYHVNLDLDRASARTGADVERLQQALNTSMTDEGVDITDRMAQSGRLVRRAKAILEAIAGADKSDPKSKLMFLHDAVRGDKDPEKHVEVGMTRAGLAQLGRAVSDEQYDNTPQGDYDAAVDGAAYWLTQGFRSAKAVKQDGKTTWVVANRKEAQEQMKELLGERPATKPLWDSMDALHDPDHPDPHGARRPVTIPFEGPPRQQTAAERGFAWDEFSHPEFADPISEEERIAMRLEDPAGLGFEGPVRPTEGGKGKWKKPKSKIRDHLSFLEQEHSPIQRALLRELVKRAKPLLPSIKERYPEAYLGEKRILHETVAYRQAAAQLREEGLDKVSAGEHAATPRDLNDTVRIALHEIKTYEREKERSDAKAAAAEKRGDSSVELRIKPEGEDLVVQTLSEQGARLEDAEQEKRITQFKRDADRLRKKITRLKEADAKAREAKVAEIEADKRIAPEYKQRAIDDAMVTLDMEYSRKVELLLAGREFEEANLIDYFNELKQHVSRPRVEGEELITTPDRDVTQPLMLIETAKGKEVLGNELRAVTGSVLATNVPRSLAMIVNDVLHHIGLNIQTRMISRGSIQAHIDALTEQRRDLYQRTVFASHALARAKRGAKTKFQADLRRAERNLRELDYEIGKLREAQDNPTWLFRAIYNDHYTLAENRVPIILVGDIGDRPVNLLPAALAHEVGHVVQRAWFDQLKPEEQIGIINELVSDGGVDEKMLAEAFANRFAEWYATRRKLQTTSNAARKAGKWGRLEQAFHDFHDMLKRVWETIRTMGARFADVQKTMLDGLDPKDPADRAVLLRTEATEFAAKYPTFDEFLSTMVGFGGNMPDAKLWKNPRWRQLVFDPILAMPAQQRVKWPSSNAELVAAAGDTEAGAFAEYEVEGAPVEAAQSETPRLEFNSKTPATAWLSNFFSAPFSDRAGRVWPTAEHAYQGMKTDDKDWQERIRNAPTAAAAKALGKQAPLRKDWNEVRRAVMKGILRTKFRSNPELTTKLLDTGDTELVHTAPWDDRVWGVDKDGKGENLQGVLLMEVREELRKDQAAQPEVPTGKVQVTKVISGGQTGGDMGGLLGAREAGVATGGTAPKGYRIDGGTNPGLASFGLTEHAQSNYVPRTIDNINNSDATVAFLWGPSVGTTKTIGYAHTGKWVTPKDPATKLDGHKPVLVITSKDPAVAARELYDFLVQTGAKTLNVAGHREVSQPGLEDFVRRVVRSVLRKDQAAQPEVTKAQHPTFEITRNKKMADVSGMRQGAGNMLTVEPGQPGWLGNPYKWEGNTGPKGVTKEEVVGKFKTAFLRLVEGDEKFRNAVLALRGKKVHYYDDPAGSHIEVVQQWLASQPEATQPSTPSAPSPRADVIEQALKIRGQTRIMFEAGVKNLIRSFDPGEKVYLGKSKLEFEQRIEAAAIDELLRSRGYELRNLEFSEGLKPGQSVATAEVWPISAPSPRAEVPADVADIVKRGKELLPGILARTAPAPFHDMSIDEFDRRAQDGLPPVKPGFVRLYRAGLASTPDESKIADWIRESPTYQNQRAASGRWFTNDFATAQWYLKNEYEGTGRLSYIDVPQAVADKHHVKNAPQIEGGKNAVDNPRAFSRDPDVEFFLPRTLSEKATAFSPPAAKASHHDMSIDEFDQRIRQAASAAAARAQRYASGTRVAQSAVVADYKKRFKGTWDAMARIGRTVFQADGTRLRNLADGRFAGVGNIIAPPMGKRMDQIQLRAIPFQRVNDVVIGTTRIFAPLHDLIGMERRRLRDEYHVFPLLNEIIELHQQDQAAYDDLLENLWDEQASTRSALAQRIRTFYKDILKELVAAGISFDATPGPNANDPTHGPTKLKIAEREGYFTKMPDIDKMLAEPDEVIEAFTKAYQARLDKGQELPENEYGVPYATARDAAVAQYERTTTGVYDDVFTDLAQQKETGLRGPAFPQARSRPFSNEEYQQFGLTRWLERDIAKVISTYLDTSARRAATQRAFGFPLQIRNNVQASAVLEERFRLARLDPSLMHTPTAAIELLIHEAERDGLLNRDGVKEAYTLIRSALGQLNVGRSPRGRRWMNRLVAYETLNTMSGSALMQLSDFGINLWRGENLGRDLGNLAKLFDGTTREQQRKILEMLGMAADHMAQHAYLTDIGTTNDPLAEGSRKVTEFMFKYNGMQKLSEYSMMLASIIGQDYMRDYARQATNATLPQAQRDKALGRLKELHPDLTPDDVLNGDLENDIRPDRRIRLRYALRRYINTSHIHDQHGYTSQIFNDWRFKPLTMLKGFMMKFHNIVLKLMWERMKEQPDLRHAVMPFVTLAICTMPLAAMGLYAKDLVRRKIPAAMGFKTKRKHKDRTPEQWIHDSFMATGMGGMYLGVMDSMFEAPQHGMPALVALGGPPITHGYTMMTRTADEWVPASIPGLNIFPAAKSGLRSELRDTFGWGVRDDEE